MVYWKGLSLAERQATFYKWHKVAATISTRYKEETTNYLLIDWTAGYWTKIHKNCTCNSEQGEQK